MRTPALGTLSDVDLMRSIASGDSECLAEAYDRHAAAAYGVARHLLIDPELSEDVLQEVFVTVWRDAHRYRPERGGLRGWICTITHNKAVDCIRHRECGREALLTPDELLRASRDAGHEEAAPEPLMGSEGDELAAIIRQLTPEQRDVVVLVFFSGLTQGQVAQRLGVPLGTVKSRLHYSMQALRELLLDVRRSHGPR